MNFKIDGINPRGFISNEVKNKAEQSAFLIEIWF